MSKRVIAGGAVALTEGMLFVDEFKDRTLRIKLVNYGSARILKLHLADELDMIVQPSKIREPGKVY